MCTTERHFRYVTDLLLFWQNGAVLDWIILIYLKSFLGCWETWESEWKSAVCGFCDWDWGDFLSRSVLELFPVSKSPPAEGPCWFKGVKVQLKYCTHVKKHPLCCDTVLTLSSPSRARYPITNWLQISQPTFDQRSWQRLTSFPLFYIWIIMIIIT